MAKSLIILSLFAVFDMVVSSDFDKFDKEFRFKRTNSSDGCNEYEFEYDLSDAEMYRGKAFILSAGKSIYVMIGKDQIYYAEFTRDEIKSEKSFSKVVQIAVKNDDGIDLKDDFKIYHISLPTGNISSTEYETRWDLKNICFTSTQDIYQTFDFVISSLNNWRTYNGTTYQENEDPVVQRIHIGDKNTHSYYDVIFTDEEVDTEDTFCRGITKDLTEYGSTTPAVIPFENQQPTGEKNINPNLLMSLVNFKCLVSCVG